MIAETKRGTIVGMDRKRIVTGDPMRGGAERYADLMVTGHRMR